MNWSLGTWPFEGKETFLTYSARWKKVASIAYLSHTPIPSLVQDASTDAAFSLLRWLQPVADVMLTAPLGLQFSCQSCGGRWRLEWGWVLGISSGEMEIERSSRSPLASLRLPFWSVSSSLHWSRHWPNQNRVWTFFCLAHLHLRDRKNAVLVITGPRTWSCMLFRVQWENRNGSRYSKQKSLMDSLESWRPEPQRTDPAGELHPLPSSGRWRSYTELFQTQRSYNHGSEMPQSQLPLENLRAEDWTLEHLRKIPTQTVPTVCQA